MYKRLKENLFVPQALKNRGSDSFGITFLLFLFFVFLLALKPSIDIISFQELSVSQQTTIKKLIEDPLRNIPCNFDHGMICDEEGVYTLDLSNAQVLFDATGTAVPDSGMLTVVLREETVQVYSTNQLLISQRYDETNVSIWPAEWTVLEVNPDSELFWTILYAGITSFLQTYRGLWIASGLIAISFNAILVLLVDVFLDTLLLKLFLVRDKSWKETLKIVLNAFTFYVIIKATLDLYGIEINQIMAYFIQLQPLLYAMIAFRTNPGKDDENV